MTDVPRTEWCRADHGADVTRHVVCALVVSDAARVLRAKAFHEKCRVERDAWVSHIVREHAAERALSQ